MAAASSAEKAAVDGEKGSSDLKGINVNLAILGHIDSGKTSLCRALSTVTSTASLDKAPASQERGITLDLGFSSFSAPAPDLFKDNGYDQIQFCLVDCPGHASLIRTVIGGAQIVDLCALVIDANKGIQAQTAECLVVAEILASQLVIILNKVDMIPAEVRAKKLKTISKKLREVFAKTKFGSELPFAYTAASPQDDTPSIGVPELVDLLVSKVHLPVRDTKGPFLFSFDHAFAIKGQGTVLTGTVLSGTVTPGKIIDFPNMGEPGKGKKVRSIQMFKKPVQQAIQGDRAAICVPNIEAKELERGLICDAKYPVPTIDACVCVVNRLHYFKHDVKTKAKFHLTLGHQTVMATVHFFCPLDDRAAASASFSSSAPAPGAEAVAAADALASRSKKGLEEGAPILSMGSGALVVDRQQKWPTSFDFGRTYLHLDELFQDGAPLEYENNDGDMVKLESAGPDQLGKLIFSLNGIVKREIYGLRFDPHSGKLTDNEDNPLGSSVDSRGVIVLKDRDRVMYLLSWLAQTCDVDGLPPVEEPLAFALLLLEKPVTCPLGSLIIGSKLDFDLHSPNCRMAFFGKILTPADPKNLNKIHLVRMKQKVGELDRVDKADPTLVICRNMFKPDSDIQLFVGLKMVHESSGIEGVCEGAYGKEGLFKIRFPESLPVHTDAKGNVKDTERIALHFKKFDFDHKKRGFIQ